MVVETRIQVNLDKFFLYSGELRMLHKLQYSNLTLSEELRFISLGELRYYTRC